MVLFYQNHKRAWNKFPTFTIELESICNVLTYGPQIYPVMSMMKLHTLKFVDSTKIQKPWERNVVFLISKNSSLYIKG